MEFEIAATQTNDAKGLAPKLLQKKAFSKCVRFGSCTAWVNLGGALLTMPFSHRLHVHGNIYFHDPVFTANPFSRFYFHGQIRFHGQMLFLKPNDFSEAKWPFGLRPRFLRSNAPPGIGFGKALIHHVDELFVELLGVRGELLSQGWSWTCHFGRKKRPMRVSSCFLKLFDPSDRLGEGRNGCSGIPRSVRVISVTFREPGGGCVPT